MTCVVTAGPTYEELDEARRLTNFSTGRLGSELARFLEGQGHEVRLLLGHYSTSRAEAEVARTQIFTTTRDLGQRLQSLSGQKVDAVFHAAAVSDFGFGKVWSRRADGQLEERKSAKLSTRDGTLLAELVPTPKIIAELRAMFPAALLVGWKYELEGDRASVIDRALSQIVECRTDACVANGRAYGEGFGLVRGSGNVAHLADRPALFAALAAMIGR
jgi:phosphopantothenoylcysteine decarboxylase/phosphopantothenate--cysteine ligase